jgi:acyl-CoA synthetase (AMP-forming)/AMP-acid ligase II
MVNIEPDEFGFQDLGDHVARTKRYVLGDVLRKGARTDPDELAVVDEHGTSLTYSALETRVNEVANALQARGVDYGDRIAILSENRAEYPVLLLAGAKLGALVGTVNWRLERAELVHCVDLIDADLTFVSGAYEEKVSWIRESDEIDMSIIHLDDGAGPTFETLCEEGAASDPKPASAPGDEDGAVVIYSSGTTGMPKAIVLSHRALIFRGMMWTTGIRGIRSGPDELIWSPLFYAGGVHPLVGGLMRRGTIRLVDGMRPDRILERLVDMPDANRLALHPGTVPRVLEAAEEAGYDTEDFSHVDLLHGIADLTHSGHMQEATELFQARWANGFGSSEVGGLLGDNLIPTGVAPDREDLGKREGPLCNVKLVDGDWNRVPQGEVGEVAYQGPTLFMGYLGNPEANDRSFRDGWFRSGDLMRREDDGCYHFLERSKYLIKSGGQNIYPAEIEQQVVEHPGITEASVAREPDDKWGEVPKLFVARSDDSMTRRGVLEHLEDRIARYKLPHYVKFVSEDSFPRSTSGEIVRADLEDWSVDSAERIRGP